MKRAAKEDWQTEPLPVRRATIHLARSFSSNEMALIKAGVIPQEMEDKWFIYFDSGHLYFHRSWTGFCIYVVSFVQDGHSGRIISALVNRDPDQFTQASEDRDQQLISYLIDLLLLGRRAQFPSGSSSVDNVVQQWSFVGRAMLGPPNRDMDTEE